MTSSDSALGATDPPTTKDTEYTQTVSKDAASIGQVSASQSGDSDSEASSGSDSEDSDSDSDDSDDSDPDSDDESSPDLISALLAAASGIPLNLPPPTDPSTPAVPSGLILDPAAANLAPTMKPNMSLASSMVSQSSSLSERLKSFIPQISESNRTLEQAGESERRKWMMETEEQGQGDGEVIEMDLALGVLEEKKRETGEDAEPKDHPETGQKQLVQELAEREEIKEHNSTA